MKKKVKLCLINIKLLKKNHVMLKKTQLISKKYQHTPENFPVIFKIVQHIFIKKKN